MNSAIVEQSHNLADFLFVNSPDFLTTMNRYAEAVKLRAVLLKSNEGLTGLTSLARLFDATVASADKDINEVIQDKELEHALCEKFGLAIVQELAMNSDFRLMVVIAAAYDVLARWIAEEHQIASQ